MVTMTCKCGKTSMTFKNLKASDFPKGWETECCKVAPEPEVKPAEAPVEVKLNEVSYSNELIVDAPNADYSNEIVIKPQVDIKINKKNKKDKK